MYTVNNESSGWGIKKIILTIIFGIIIYHIIKEDEIIYGPGVKAERLPSQDSILLKDSFKFKGYDFEKLASYDIEAKVLSRKDYSDFGALFSPTDLALGWGNMSDEKVLEKINISQSGRWYRWNAKELPIPINEIKNSSANTHIIPANKNIEYKLSNVIKGNVVSMKGYLVKITGKNNYRWESSTSRTDSGNGACELFYVESLNIVNIK